MIGDIRFWEWQGHPECGLQFGMIQYDLAQPYANLANAVEVLSTVGKFGLTQLGLARVQCIVRAQSAESPDNATKIEALTKAGFQQEGILHAWWYDGGSQQWIDEIMFSLVERDLQ
jgi:RimJ/RimL family protein N-acetyltransferase